MTARQALRGCVPLVAPILLATASAPPPATEAPSAQDQFEALVKEIGGLRADLENLDRHERTLVNEMDRLEVESALHARELARLAAMKQKTARDLDETRARLVSSRTEAGRQEAGLARQLRAAYEMGRSRELRMALSLAEPVDVMRAIAYIDVVSQRQSGVVAALRRERGEIQALERSLEIQAGSLDDLESQQKARAAELLDVRRRSADLLASTREERDAHRRAIGELTRAAEELEAAIVSNTVMPGEPAGVPAIDVDRLRGALEWPVPGEVAVPFGDIRDPKFGTVTPHPGLDIRTKAREPIRAILPGRVLFSRRFSGYGNTVLLDHGGHYLSVYARAAVVNVTEGEPIVAGQPIGFSADQAFDGGPPTVYFELRRDGRSVDPAPWLKRKAASRREDDR